MNSLLSFVLDLYRLAQEAPATEFPDLALEMLKTVVRFRTATWSDAEITRDGALKIDCVRLHEEPREILLEFAAFNRKHVRRVIAAARQAGKAHIINETPAFYDSRQEAAMRDYIKRYGHHHNMLITDLSQWISLYRPANDAPFCAADGALLSALMPHVTEAITINQALAKWEWTVPKRTRRSGTRALVDCQSGAFLHCATPFLELLRRQWSDWSEPRIPPSLLAQLLSSPQVRIAAGTVEISAQTFGDALLLTASAISPLERLSPRERAVAREFGAGKPYKTIAREIQLAPSTVRNLLQRAYKKLGIDNKAALVRLVEREHTHKSPIYPDES